MASADETDTGTAAATRTGHARHHDLGSKYGLADSTTASPHAEENWRKRGDPEIDLLQAWETAIPIEWPNPITAATTARFHPNTQCSFLWKRGVIVTVYPPLKYCHPDIYRAVRDQLPPGAVA